MKLVVNEDYGGFGISFAAASYIGFPEAEIEAQRKRDEDDHARFYKEPIEESDYWGFRLYGDAQTAIRTNAKLIEFIEKFGSKAASGKYAELAIVEFSEPYYIIEEYDGMESVYVSDSLGQFKQTDRTNRRKDLTFRPVHDRMASQIGNVAYHARRREGWSLSRPSKMESENHAARNKDNQRNRRNRNCIWTGS
jgi:hypothetical protein